LRVFKSSTYCTKGVRTSVPFNIPFLLIIRCYQIILMQSNWGKMWLAALEVNNSSSISSKYHPFSKHLDLENRPLWWIRIAVVVSKWKNNLIHKIVLPRSGCIFKDTWMSFNINWAN
jgi:hypothetical protein